MNLFYTCDTEELFGGYKHFGKDAIIQKSFQDLPPHSSVHIQFELIKFNNWNN